MSDISDDPAVPDSASAWPSHVVRLPPPETRQAHPIRHGVRGQPVASLMERLTPQKSQFRILLVGPDEALLQPIAARLEADGYPVVRQAQSYTMEGTREILAAQARQSEPIHAIIAQDDALKEQYCLPVESAGWGRNINHLPIVVLTDKPRRFEAFEEQVAKERRELPRGRAVVMEKPPFLDPVWHEEQMNYLAQQVEALVKEEHARTHSRHRGR